ncbi:MAG: hypothetical protein KBT18_08705, partial [Comamonas sp.]|nr:hypothetical protein [Candidatus Comamonas equi]
MTVVYSCTQDIDVAAFALVFIHEKTYSNHGKRHQLNSQGAHMRVLTLVLMAILGLPLTFGGAYLLALGGSPFYFISGVAVLVAAFGFIKRSRWALPLYAVWMLVLLVWSLYEAGLHWWPLSTRLGLPAIIGFVMAIPASRRDSNGNQP